jgi:mono/diheme cytochrome c family protein
VIARAVCSAVTVALVVLVLTAAVLPAAAMPAVEHTPPPAVPTPEELPDASAGLEIFADRCAECHGPMGRGFGALTSQLPAPPPSFADPAFMRGVTPAGTFDVVTTGRMEQGMPPWGEELSAQDRWDAVYGLWSYSYTPDRLTRGRAVWDDACAECHDDDAPAPWPEGRLLEVSQTDLLARLWDVDLQHDALVEMPALDVALALDYARSRTFEALPIDGLSVDGTLLGRFSNGTDSDLGVPGAEVRIVPFSGAVPGDSDTATVDAAGAYTFTNLVAGPQIVYRVVATYGGADFVHPDDLEIPAGGEARADFEVFEPSTDEQLTVRAGHIVVSPLPERGTARVVEMWLVANDGQRTRVAPLEGSTLRLALPAAATNLGIDDPALRAHASVEDGSILLDAPFAPGEREVVITYELPYSGTELLFERDLDLPTESLQLMAVAPGAEVSSEQLGPPSVSEMGGQSVVTAFGTQLAPPLTVVVNISGLPASRPETGSVRPLPSSPVGASVLGAIGLALAGVGALAALAYPVVAARRGTAGRGERLEREYGHLVRRIADLDARRAAGRIGSERYRDERAASLDRAIALRRRLDDLRLGEEGT